MEQNKEPQLFENDKHFWEDPVNHALLREKNGDEQHYSMYILAPVFMMSLIDDMKYAEVLAQKMIENGVKVFDDFKELSEWSKEVIAKQGH